MLGLEKDPNCFIDIEAPVSKKVEPSSIDDDDSSDRDPDFSSDMEILARPNRAVRAQASRADGQT